MVKPIGTAGGFVALTLFGLAASVPASGTTAAKAAAGAPAYFDPPQETTVSANTRNNVGTNVYVSSGKGCDPRGVIVTGIVTTGKVNEETIHIRTMTLRFKGKRGASPGAMYLSGERGKVRRVMPEDLVPGQALEIRRPPFSAQYDVNRDFKPPVFVDQRTRLERYDQEAADCTNISGNADGLAWQFGARDDSCSVDRSAPLSGARTDQSFALPIRPC